MGVLSVGAVAGCRHDLGRVRHDRLQHRHRRPAMGEEALSTVWDSSEPLGTTGSTPTDSGPTYGPSSKPSCGRHSSFTSCSATSSPELALATGSDRIACASRGGIPASMTAISARAPVERQARPIAAGRGAGELQLESHESDTGYPSRSVIGIGHIQSGHPGLGGGCRQGVIVWSRSRVGMFWAVVSWGIRPVCP
jgi:hypothetical protein